MIIALCFGAEQFFGRRTDQTLVDEPIDEEFGILVSNTGCQLAIRRGMIEQLDNIFDWRSKKRTIMLWSR
eukprot:3462489-Amphidinium_carterae.1